MSHLIKNVKAIVKDRFQGNSGDHDWQHILRVYNLALKIQEHEGGDKTVIELVALLHDISDHKLNGGQLNQGGIEAKKILIELNCDSNLANRVSDIIDKISYKGAFVVDQMDTLEGKIVQDADRLDAIGAIGIARAFSYGGSKNRALYEDDVEPTLHDEFEKYTQSATHTINHFYEKLLLLYDRLHTNTAKKIGKQRHQFLKDFLATFFKEWEESSNLNINTKQI